VVTICLCHYVWGLVKDIWDCFVVMLSAIHNILNILRHLNWISCCIPNTMVVNYLHQYIKSDWNERVTFLCVICMNCVKLSMVGILFVCIFHIKNCWTHFNWIWAFEGIWFCFITICVTPTLHETYIEFYQFSQKWLLFETFVHDMQYGSNLASYG
jgi:hypothetical protein